jgi:hypothetical protein
MQKAEQLREARNLLLKLHKTLIDHERAIYEGINGPLTAGAFLNLLLEHSDFGWLRKFSTLIVDIDEMFDQKDAATDESVEVHLVKLRELVTMEREDEVFRARYQAALQQDIEAASRQGELRGVLGI